MTLDAFEATLNAMLKRQPFRRFTVELMNGSSVEVSHPEALVIRKGVGVFFGKDHSMNIFDYDGVVQITSGKTRLTTTG